MTIPISLDTVAAESFYHEWIPEYIYLLHAYTTGPWFNIKIPSYQYRKSHCGDKTILRPSHLHNGISYTGKTSSLYWIRALIVYNTVSDMRTCSPEAGPWFNIKMSSYQYRKSHCGDKTVVRSSYLHNGISYTGKTTSLYWIRALIVYNTVSDMGTCSPEAVIEGRDK